MIRAADTTETQTEQSCSGPTCRSPSFATYEAFMRSLAQMRSFRTSVNARSRLRQRTSLRDGSFSAARTQPKQHGNSHFTLRVHAPLFLKAHSDLTRAILRQKVYWTYRKRYRGAYNASSGHRDDGGGDVTKIKYRQDNRRGANGLVRGCDVAPRT